MELRKSTAGASPQSSQLLEPTDAGCVVLDRDLG